MALFCTIAPVFPTELFYSIIQNVDAVEDLLVLSLCCSKFRQEAQRLLFRHPVTPTHKDLMLFIHAICSDSPRLGPLVHAFTMAYDTGPVSQDETFIVHALGSMCNLQQIKHRASVMPLRIYKHCKAPLESFQYYGFHRKATLDRSSLVYDVLSAQPYLTRIILDGLTSVRISSELMEAAADLCPNLMSLKVRNDAVGKMLLQRKKHIRSLEWMVGTSTPTSLAVPQYNHLNYLMLWFLRRGLNTSFAQHLTSLVLLELRFDLVLEDDILFAETQFIAHIPHLQYLILYADIVTISRSFEGGQQIPCPKLALRAFRMQKTLKHIDISSLVRKKWDPSVYLRVFAPLTNGDVVQRLVPKTEVDAIRIKCSLH